MKTDVAKTKVMRIENKEKMTITTSEGKVQHVGYLLNILTENCRCKVEANTWIAMTKEAFNKNNAGYFEVIWVWKTLCVERHCYMDAKSTLFEEEIEGGMVKTFEVWIRRRAERIKCCDRVRNENI